MGMDGSGNVGESSHLSKMKMRVCKDCQAQGIKRLRPAPHPGPRCTTHHRTKKKTNSERAAEARWLQNYGLTPDRYKDLLEQQGGGCGICGRPPGRRRLAVDHDHTCCPGKTSCGRCVRGLLCWTDNKWLEHIKDNPVAVARAARYLQFPPAQTVKKKAT